MNEQNKNDGFSYTYSSKEQEEIRRIREKYVSPTAADEESAECKLGRLLRLDAESTKRGKAVSLILGVLGTLLLGTGMSLCMTELGAALGAAAMIVGISVGAVGIIFCILSYPIYGYITKKERERIAPEIIKLSDELMK